MITIMMMTIWQRHYNDDKQAGDPHEPFRKQLVSHSLQHCTASSSCLQVTIHDDNDDDDIYDDDDPFCLEVREVLLPI